MERLIVSLIERSTAFKALDLISLSTAVVNLSHGLSTKFQMFTFCSKFIILIAHTEKFWLPSRQLDSGMEMKKLRADPWDIWEGLWVVKTSLQWLWHPVYSAPPFCHMISPVMSSFLQALLFSPSPLIPCWVFSADIERI